MSDTSKILAQMRREPSNVRFSELKKVCRCEFRFKLDSDSSRNWTVIPAQTGQ
jgi:hypothetical protein